MLNSSLHIFQQSFVVVNLILINVETNWLLHRSPLVRRYSFTSLFAWSDLKLEIYICIEKALTVD